MKKLILAAFIFTGITSFAQKQSKHDIGINTAGLFIKKQATVAPALFYRYEIKNYQLRLQLCMDGNQLNKDRNVTTNNGGAFGSFGLDTVVKYDPAKNIRYGIIAGIQRNISIENIPFSCYYGLDFFYMMNDFAQKGSGKTVMRNGGFDQEADIKVKMESRLKTYGIGIPIGITYKFGTRFYTSLESKFVIAYQKGKEYSLVEANQKQQDFEILSKSESTVNNEGFDLGIKPITGLCLGFIF